MNKIKNSGRIICARSSAAITNILFVPKELP